jgi:hypothetical protein
LAKLVFPVPGGPNKMTAFGGETPYCAAVSGSTSGSTMRFSMSCFSRSIPAIACHSPSVIT